MEKLRTIYQNADRKVCVFCFETLDFSNGWKEERNYCLHRKPDCSVEHHNFMRSIEKAKQSKSVLMVQFAINIENALQDGVSPKTLKPIYTFVNKNKRKFFKTKTIKTKKTKVSS